MLKHICFAHEKMKAEKHCMISGKCGKTRVFSEYPRFVVFYHEKYLKSAPAAEGGGGAIKFSAEIMVNRVIWQIVECICFLHEKKQNSCRTAPIFSVFT